MTRSIIILFSFMLFSALFSIGALGADQGTTKTVSLSAQKTCPITGDPNDKDSKFVDADGYRIYYCCPGCAKTIKADPQKAIRTLLARGEAPKTIAVTKPQTKCPIMGDEVNKKLYVDANGYRIYVCCSMCVREARADPEKTIKKILANGETPEPRPVLYVQSKCPITGKSINKSLFFDDKEGRRIYVADQASLAKVKANPAKAVDRILANGEGLEQVGKHGAKVEGK